MRLARAHPRATRWLAGGALAWVAACFALGYRLPGFDQHPDWPEFPQTTNPRLVVEPIPDEEFEYRYAHRFPQVLGRQRTWQRFHQWDLDDLYGTNLHNIRLLGFQATENRFEEHFLPHLYWNLGTPNGGNERDNPEQNTRFYQKGYEYFKIYNFKQNGYFKIKSHSEHTWLESFYQYNVPKNTSDTLYINYFSDNWRVVSSSE